MTDLQLIIGNKNYSSWSLRPWIFMKNFNLEFEEKRIPLLTTTTDQELAQYNSNYKVPVLVHNGLNIWDSLSILEYLSETFLNGAGWPSEQKARAVARSVCAEMHSSFTDIRNELPMNCRKQFTGFKPSAGTCKDVERIKNIWRQCRNDYCASGGWLFGEYSIADAMFAPVVLRFTGYGIKLDGLEKEYVKLILDSPYMNEWIEAGKAEKEIIEMDEVDA